MNAAGWGANAFPHAHTSGSMVALSSPWQPGGALRSACQAAPHLGAAADDALARRGRQYDRGGLLVLVLKKEYLPLVAQLGLLRVVKVVVTISIAE